MLAVRFPVQQCTPQEIVRHPIILLRMSSSAKPLRDSAILFERCCEEISLKIHKRLVPYNFQVPVVADEVPLCPPSFRISVAGAVFASLLVVVALVMLTINFRFVGRR